MSVVKPVFDHHVQEHNAPNPAARACGAAREDKGNKKREKSSYQNAFKKNNSSLTSEVLFKAALQKLSLKYTYSVFIFLFLCGGTAMASDKNTSGEDVGNYSQASVLDENAGVDADIYLPDFSYAGYKNSETPIAPIYGTIIDVDTYGAVANDGKDDTLAIQKALSAARAVDGPVTLRFGRGTYVVTEILKIDRSHLILQGAGAGEDGSNLHFPRPLQMVDSGSKFDELRAYLLKYNKRQREKDNNLDVLFSEYSWTGGFVWIEKDGGRPAAYLEEKDPPIKKLADIVSGERGKRTVTVDNATNLTKGEAIQIQWFNRVGEKSPLIAELYGAADVEVGSHHWTFPDRPLVRQRTRVVSVEGQTVTVSDPLLHAINQDIPAQFSHWSPMTEIGIEDIQFTFPNAPVFGHHVERGYNAIYFTSTIDGWVRNIRIVNADSGILTYDSANLTLQNIVSEGDRKGHYAVHIGSVHNVLVDGLEVFNETLHSATFNTQSTKSVYHNVTLYKRPTLDQHAGSNHQNLFDRMIVHISPRQGQDGRWIYPLYDGSGAPYWQPGHGAFNTTWNMKIVVEGGPYADEPVYLDAIDEGPNARILGLYGTRPLFLDYRPAPFMKWLNTPPPYPSLYKWQLEKRLVSKEQE